MRSKYSVEYVFFSSDGNIIGGLPKKTMTLDDLEFMIRVLAPMKSAEIMGNVSSLYGMSYSTFSVEEMIGDGIIIKKCLKIRRCR